MTRNLTDLPLEIIESLLVLCDPRDVAQVAQTSRFLHALVYESKDEALWRDLYLSQPLDDPRKCVGLCGERRSSSTVDWKTELQNFIRMRTVVSKLEAGQPGELGRILQTILDLVSYSPPKYDSDPHNCTSKTLVTIQDMMTGGLWIDAIKAQELDAHETQLINRLHTYHGLTPNDLKDVTRAKERSFIYNMKNYSGDTDYGPYDAEGNVNWVHVNAVRNVISMQLALLGLPETIGPLDESFSFALYPLSLPYIQPALLQEQETGETSSNSDWAGVAGEWMISFCFCDHRELLVFNDDVDAPGYPEDYSMFENEDFQEIFRCKQVDISIINTKPDAAYPDRPKIHFIGVMKDHSDSTLNGSVRMTKDGYVRWSFVGGEGGNVIWSSDGIQIGGLRSEYGILGSWTTVFHDLDDPIGPFWLRKIPTHGKNPGMEKSDN